MCQESYRLPTMLSRRDKWVPKGYSPRSLAVSEK